MRHFHFHFTHFTHNQHYVPAGRRKEVAAEDSVLLREGLGTERARLAPWVPNYQRKPILLKSFFKNHVNVVFFIFLDRVPNLSKILNP